MTQRGQGTKSEWHSQVGYECENILEGEIHHQSIIVNNSLLIQLCGAEKIRALESFCLRCQSQLLLYWVHDGYFLDPM